MAAIYDYRGRGGINTAELARMRDHMATRGPDGQGEWVDLQAGVALGHRRLAIIDLSETGVQPMALPEADCVITFNGEIYNYRELRESLMSRGHGFRSESDTEVVLRLYAEKGVDMLHDLRGMFVFALWDGRRRGLLLARDPYGIKPLYYADDGSTVRAASQVKALLASGPIDTGPEPAGHVGFFLLGSVPEPYTLFRGVRALPAGSYLWVDESGGGGVNRYADVAGVFRDVSRPEHAHDADRQGVLHDFFLDCVQHHLVADVEVGLFLSAGVDSTVLAALTVESGARLRTVTLGYEEYRGTTEDEVPLAGATAARLGVDHEAAWVTSEDFRRELPRLLQSMDQPSIDGVNTYFVSWAAARLGLKVALSGLGGDELFGGYPSFRQIPRLVDFVSRVPARAALGPALRAASMPILSRLTSPKYAGILEYGGEYGGAYLLRRGLYMPWELSGFLDADFVRDGLRELALPLRLEETASGIRSSRCKIAALESCWYMRNQLLRDADWAGMAHSLEIRVPFVDWLLLSELAPFVAAEPPLDKLHLARTPEIDIPREISARSKTGFTIPVRQWQQTVLDHASDERGLRGWARYVYAQLGQVA